jgi:hypothetical protein
MVDVGDIILFRTANTIASAQRMFTRSEFDHVAMITRKPILSKVN